jgi:hypothetical protein
MKVAPHRVSGRVVKISMRIALRGVEDHLGALARFADPVALHHLDALRPVDGVQVVDQLLGVVG